MHRHEHGLTRTTTVTLTVTATAPPFTVSALPSTRTIAAGAGTTFAVTIGRTGSFAGAVSLSVSGLPARLRLLQSDADIRYSLDADGVLAEEREGRQLPADHHGLGRRRHGNTTVTLIVQ